MDHNGIYIYIHIGCLWLYLWMPLGWLLLIMGYRMTNKNRTEISIAGMIQGMACCLYLLHGGFHQWG